MIPTTRKLLLIGLVLVSAACSRLPTRPEIPAETALPAATEGTLADLIAPAEAAHPDQSGFNLVGDGGMAFALRARSAKVAVRSLDIQTYIWHDDVTGLLLAKAALDAADRGVRVRILLDDMDARDKNKGLAALDAHDKVEVRLFNPFASRSGKAAMVGEMVGGGMKRLNRRMHNKSWIVDNRLALVGGRNLGDEYFDASEQTNFIDLGLLMAGPVVREASASFDRYWNSTPVWPIATLSPELVTPAALLALRDALAKAEAAPKADHYTEALREDNDVQRMLAGKTPLSWSRGWTFVSDDPMKALRKGAPGDSSVVAALTPVIRTAKTSVSISSPYFVPGEDVTTALVARVGSGVRVRVLTNSLAATDVAAVHGGYARYRQPLLRGGVGLWEIKPTGKQRDNFSLYGSSGSSLHSKSLVVDEETLFVGSYNLDPRSTALNCEQGVLVRDAAIATTLERVFERKLQGPFAWQVQLDADGLRWDDGSKTWREDPEASGGRKFQAWLSRLLPVESQL